MKLSQLNPRWVGLKDWCGDSKYFIGLTFDSPTHPEQRLSVLFTPPIDPDGLGLKYGFGTPFPEEKKWQRTGDTFETITLTPSLDFSASGHWHGFITNGDVL